MRERAVGLLLLLVSSCGGGKTVDEFCKARFDAMVDRDKRCGVPEDAAQATWDPVGAYLCKGVLQLEKDRKIVYDAGQGGACLERIKGLACGPLFSVPNDPCDLAIVGKVADGGSCYTGIECLPGSLCESSSCPGTCSARVPVGGACGGVARCAAGAYCLKGSCVASAALGEACRVGSIDCAAGLYCSGTTPAQSTPGACEPVAARSNGACDQSLACAAGTVCAGLDYASNSNGTCQAPAAVGAACVASSFCEPAAWCADHVCKARPRVGEDCGTLPAGSATCLLGWCKFPAGASLGTCTDFLEAGAACDSVNACGSLARCEGSKCVPLCAQ